jgi:hypothetical protein
MRYILSLIFTALITCVANTIHAEPLHQTITQYRQSPPKERLDFFTDVYSRMMASSDFENLTTECLAADPDRGMETFRQVDELMLHYNFPTPDATWALIGIVNATKSVCTRLLKN